MRAKELFEGRDAPLYHGTSYVNAKAILGTNLLKAQPLPDDDDWDTRDMPVISLSRSLPFVKDFIQRREKGKGVIFQLDQRKLAQRFKIRPWNYYVNAELSTTARISKNVSGIFNEYEEFITKDIKNFDSYITAIHCFDPNVPDWLKGHPKLKLHVEIQTKKLPKPKRFGEVNDRAEIARLMNIPVDEIFAARKVRDQWILLAQDVDDPSVYQVALSNGKTYDVKSQSNNFNHAKVAFQTYLAGLLVRAAI